MGNQEDGLAKAPFGVAASRQSAADWVENGGVLPRRRYAEVICT